MATKKCVADLKAHLACFDPVYPLMKGYIARLMEETRDPSKIAMIRKVKTLIPTTFIDQDKCVDEMKLSTALRALQRELKLKKSHLSTHWDSLILLFQQPFPVHFKEVSNTAVLQHMQISSPTEVPSISATMVELPSPSSIMTIASQKCIGDLKAYLACFGPVYPFKKGYIAQLLMGTRAPSITVVMRKVKAHVPITSAEQDKYVDEIKFGNDLRAFQKEFKQKKCRLSTNWDLLVRLFQQPFPVFFKELSNTVLLQPQEISSATDVSNVSVATVRPPSPKKLRYDCHNCITKQRTFNNLREAIVTLSKRLLDQKRQHAQELAKIKSIWITKGKSAFVKSSHFTKVKNSFDVLRVKRNAMNRLSSRKIDRHSTKNGYVDRNFIMKAVETTQLNQIARNIDGVSDLPSKIKQELDYESAEKNDAILDPMETLKQELGEETVNNVDVLDLRSHIKQELDLEAAENIETFNHNQTELVEQDPDYDIEMKVDVSDQTFMSVPAVTSTETDSFIDTAISPTSSVFKSDNTIEDSLNKSVWDTLTEEEEALFTHLVKRKLKTGKHNIITCKSNGLPIVLQKMTDKQDFRW